MEDYTALWDNYSIQFNKTLEYGCGGDWDRLDYCFKQLWQLRREEMQ